MMFKKIIFIIIYSKNHKKSIHILHEKTARCVNVKPGGTYGHSPTNIIVMFWKVWHKLNFMQGGIKHTYIWLHMYRKGSSAEIQAATDWNLISHSMTTCLLLFHIVIILIILLAHSSNVSLSTKILQCWTPI
jgi:hypothetical protein